MARYVVHVRTPMPPAEAFAYMADLNNFARWDPGVDGVEQVEGAGPGAKSVFDVSVKAVVGTMTLRYETTRYEPTTLVVARAESSTLTSLDTARVGLRADRRPGGRRADRRPRRRAGGDTDVGQPNDEAGPVQLPPIRPRTTAVSAPSVDKTAPMTHLAIHSPT